MSPCDLTARVAAVGLTTFAVTDHDTTAGLAEAREAAAHRGLNFIDAIEITAVEDGRDVHILGYYIDPADRRLAAFLEAQRADRVRRVVEIIERLSNQGCAVDSTAILARASARGGRSVGRPLLADALVAAGHAADRTEAFDRYLGERGSAFVPRRGAPATAVVRAIRDAGGIASLAHPGLTRRDDLIPSLAAAGLAAIEVRHSEHDALTEARYRELAHNFGLDVSGGSDYHGEGTPRAASFGVVVLPAADFARLQARAADARRSA